MPVEARRLLKALGLGFALLGLWLGLVQFGLADRLAGDPRNPRLCVSSPSTRRGGILARGGEVITAGPAPMARIYPVPSLCHTAGYTDPRFGASGLEAAYDRALAGRDPRSVWASWLAEVRGGTGQGADLLTTLDMRVQAAAARALGRRAGAVVVLDAANGDILALVSQPGFHDPPTVRSWTQDLARADGPFVHRGLQGLYPPGSSFKIVTAAAALRADQGGFVLDCRGQTTIGTRRIKDAQASGHGRVDLARALAVSCNIYFTRLGARMGGGTLIDQARAFGLGSAPPNDLKTAAGKLPDPRNEAELAETAMGQGRLLVSPLQMALVAAAVVNDGVLMRPRLIQAIRYLSGTEEMGPRIWRRPLSAEAAATLRRALEGAVRTGTGRRAISGAGYVVGGKTGTAQAPGGRPHAWFVGFAHRPGRRLAIAVVVEHAGSGGAVAAPIAAAVWRAAGGETS